MKRIFTAVLAAAMTLTALGTLSSCKKQPPLEKKVVDHVYRATTVKQPEDLSWIQYMFAVGDKLYVSGSYYDEETYTEHQRTYSMSLDGSALVRDDFPALAQPDPESGKYVQQLLPASDGSVWRSVYSSAYNEETRLYTEEYFLQRVGADGTVLFERNCSEFWGKETTDADGNQIWHYISRMKLFGDGLMFFDNNDMYLLDAEGNLQSKLNMSEMEQGGYVQEILTSGDVPYLLYIDYSGATQKVFLIPIDIQAGKAGEKIELDSTTFRNVWNFFEGPGYTFYYSDDEGLYGYDTATQTSTFLMSYLNSDLTSSATNNLIILSPDRMISRGWDEMTGEEVIMLLDRVPEEEIVPKYIMTLATLGSSYNVQNYVIRFNRQSTEYRFQVKTYSPEDYYTGTDYGEDYDYNKLLTEALNALNNDIVAGNIPDVLVVDPSMPIDGYIAKGLFVDLYEKIDADERFSREDFLENVLRAYEVNGKLYEIAPQFYIRTLAGKTSMVGDRKGWTMAEFVEWLETVPENARVFYDRTRDELLELFCTYAYEEFVDPDTGKCSFDSPEFRMILEYVRTLSNQSIWDTQNGEYQEEFWQDYDNRFRLDLAVLEEVHLTSLSSFVSTLNYTFYSPEVTLVGMPAVNGNGAAISTDMSFAVSAKSRMIDGAWEFVSYFLTEEYQDATTWYFPIRKTSLDAMVENEIQNAEEQKKNWEDRQNGDYYYNGGYATMPAVETAAVETTSVAVDMTSSSVTAVVTSAAPAVPTEPEVVETELVDVNGDGVIDDSDAIDTPVELPVDTPIVTPVYPQQQERYFLDRAMAEKLVAYVKSANHVLRRNTSVYDIIKEEASAYFADQKSLDETVKLIQNRVSMYVAERR